MSLQVSNSDALAFLRCQRKWGFSSINRQNLAPKGPQAKALMVGSLVHHGLEFALNEHVDPAAEVMRKGLADIETFKAEGPMFDEEVEALTEEAQFAADIVAHYCSYWRWAGHNLSTVEPYTVRATEVTFSVPIPHTPHQYVGTFDALLEDPHGRVWVMDHKTYSRPSRREKQELLWQFRSYAWVLGQLFPGTEVGGTIYNGLRKQIPTEPQPLKNGSLSRAKTTLNSTTAVQYLSAISKHGLKPQDYEDEIRVLLNRDKNENPFFERYEMHRNVHTEVSWLESMTNLVKQMEVAGVPGGGRPLVPNFRWEGCGDCSYKRLCSAFERAESPPLHDFARNTSYQTAQALELTPEVVTSLEDL